MRRRAPDVSLRVLLSVREHLVNRGSPDPVRVFVNREGRAWITADERAPLNAREVVAALDEAIVGAAPALRGRARGAGDRRPAVGEDAGRRAWACCRAGRCLPAGRHVRFFIYWKQRSARTDYDLSVLFLDKDFTLAGQVSFTNLSGEGAAHSGDITEAPDGASEFIDIDFSKVDARYVVPTVNVYSGEGFDAVEQAFFGYMERTPEQQGRPFEPRTVRAKSDLFGGGRVMLPVIFERSARGVFAKWLHLNLRGHPNFNRVEVNHLSTSLIVRGLMRREYLTLDYLHWMTQRSPGPPVTVGLEDAMITPANLTELLNPV